MSSRGLCVCVFRSFCKDTSHVGSGPTLMTPFHLNYRRPSPNAVTSEVLGVRASTCDFGEGTRNAAHNTPHFPLTQLLPTTVLVSVFMNLTPLGLQICGITQCLSFCVCLTSLSIVSSRFTSGFLLNGHEWLLPFSPVFKLTVSCPS